MILLTLSVLFAWAVTADIDNQNVKRAVLDDIASQHKIEPELMKRGLDKKLAKRAYRKSKDGSKIIMEDDFGTMLWVAEDDNKENNKLMLSPKVDINIPDIDNRVVSVKLTVCDLSTRGLSLVWKGEVPNMTLKKQPVPSITCATFAPECLGGLAWC